MHVSKHSMWYFFFAFTGLWSKQRAKDYSVLLQIVLYVLLSWVMMILFKRNFEQVYFKKKTLSKAVVLLTNFAMIPPYFRLFLNVCMRILGSGHGSMLVGMSPPRMAPRTAWPFRQPMLAAAGKCWGLPLQRLPFPVPDAPAATVQQNSRGQRPQSGMFYGPSAGHLHPGSIEFFFRFTNAILYILICISIGTNTFTDLQTQPKKIQMAIWWQ